MRHRAPTRTAAAVFAALLSLGAVAACDEGGTPEQTGQLPAGEPAAPNAQPGAQPGAQPDTQPAPPPAAQD